MEIDDYAIGYQGNDEATCLVCGSDMDFVRPGKWQCQKCELDEMLQQAHREGKAEGIRLGWEQGKQQASGICKADIQEHAITISAAQQETHNNCCNYLAKAIDAMEYNHGN